MSNTKPIRAAFDTQVVAWALRDNDPEDDEHKEKITRANLLVTKLSNMKAVVVIPTIVISEVLARVDETNRSNFVSALQESAFLAPFDLKAAILAARLFNDHHTLVERGTTGDRRFFKADTMIVASAKIAGATEFYSFDERCRKMADAAGMDGRDLPLFDENLFPLRSETE